MLEQRGRHLAYHQSCLNNGENSQMKLKELNP
jgi:hypothetical protein